MYYFHYSSGLQASQYSEDTYILDDFETQQAKKGISKSILTSCAWLSQSSRIYINPYHKA